MAGEITSMQQVFDSGKPMLESQIVDILLPDLKEEVMDVDSMQRMTAYGRKQVMRAVVIIGNKNGFVGVGVGRAPESRQAIEEAIADAKRHLVRVQLGCGSWECGCGTAHSITKTVLGQRGSTKITIKPAPRGLGIVAGEVARKVLEFAGVRDVWTFSKGRTRNILNMVLATMSALDSLNKTKQGKKGVEVA
ncbi:MAG: 30S ribosomal protein S5 [Candidatus Micrarchaeota archaeon]